MTTESDGAAEGTDTGGQDLAGLGERVTALVIDWVSCLVLVYLLDWIGTLPPGPDDVNIATPSLFIVYYTACMAFGSQSLGMAIMRIACVSATTGDRLGFWRALVRAVLLSLVLPALTAFGHPYHRGLHDLAAGSVMLKTTSRSASETR